METAEKKPVEHAVINRDVKKAEPPFKRVCKGCERKITDEHETICIECGATTKEV